MLRESVLMSIYFLDQDTDSTYQICTDIFYQPLALLDCLHTFCGSCLKEWFAQQASTATSIHPYTCPSCRAPVRATTKHAWINTILEQYMKTNPDKGKTEEEKTDIRKTYKPGDNVMPKLRRRRRPEDDRDREVMDRVRDLSLSEAGVTPESPPMLQAPRPRERRSRSRSNDPSRRHHRSRESSSSGVESLARPPRVTPSTIAGPPTARQVAHQSSLRSLLSASDFDAPDLEEALLRQVVEEGILDGIDLDNMSSMEEEQIQQAIYDAFRRLRREHARGRHREGRSTNTSPNGAERTGTVTAPTSDSAGAQTQSSRPPISRPHLFNAANEQPRASRRRTSSQGSSRSVRTDSHQGLILPPTNGHSASRSTSDLSLDPPRTEGSAGRPRRASANTRRITDPVQPRGHPHPSQALSDRRSNSNPTTPLAGPSELQPREIQQHSTFPVASSSPRATSRNTSTSNINAARPSTEPGNSQLHEMAAGSSNRSAARSELFYEPSLSCDRCQKPDIQYKAHFNCAKCNNGTFNICQQCFRKGDGCCHWFGFTPETADAKFARIAPSLPPSQQVEAPHMLIGHRYRRPKQAPVRSSSDSRRMMTDEDPSKRLEAGVFCDICSAFANDCYWKCDKCNDGEWGYCNTCVNQLKHCTHAFLPLTHRSAIGNKAHNTHAQTNAAPDQDYLAVASPASPPLTPNSFSELASPDVVFVNTLHFYPYSFTTDCDICHKPIPPSQSRYHCPDCNGGDYDICNTCYPLQVTKGRIRREDGPSGWRRCLRGHRMAIVGFEDRVGGQRRVVVADRVGGLALKDEPPPAGPVIAAAAPQAPTHLQANGMQWSWRDEDNKLRTRSQSVSPASTSAHLPLADQQRYPPSGGVGLRISALYGWYPAEDAADELMFPKGAEITEAEDINGDWFWGCYAGGKGLFPGNYGRVIRRVE